MNKRHRNKFCRKNLTASAVTLAALTLAFGSSLPSQASIIINEVDYDQPGTDNAEFIELFNSGTGSLSLDDHYIDLINGGTSSVYRNIDLSGFNIAANGYFVVCNDVTLVKNCNYAFTTSTGWMQNGAPDAVALYDGTGLQDSLSYEGLLLPFSEGNALTIGDSNSLVTSISRLPNGIDTNDNLLDFKLGCITPGTANISGTGDCSIAIGPSPVPLPPAVILFGSGLIGLAGLARRANPLEV